MSGQRKKSRKPVQSHTDDETFEASDEEIEFEGRDVKPGDYHGIKLFLQQLFVSSDVDVSAMSDMVIGSQVGTVLHQIDFDNEEVDDKDVYIFAITGIVNISSNMKINCVQQLIKLIRELSSKHADEHTCALIERALAGKLGFLINERFLNIPTKVSTNMLKSLQGDLDKAKRKDSSYDFDHIVMISKIFKPKDQHDVTYMNEEEEIFIAEADASFEVSVGNETESGTRHTTAGVALIPYRKVIIFKADKLPSIISKVESYVSG